MLLALVARLAVADPADVDVELLRPSLGDGAFSGVELPDLDRGGTIRVGTALQAERSVQTAAGAVDRLSSLVGASLDVGRVTVGLTVPAALTRGPTLSTGPGLGDLSGSARVALAGRRGGALGLGLRSGIALPTGLAARALGDGGVRLSGGLVGAARAGALTLATDLGGELSPSGVDLTWGNAARFALPAASRLALDAQLLARAPARDPRGAALEAIGGVELYPSRATTVELGVGRGLTSGLGATDLRVLARFVMALRPPEAPRPAYTMTTGSMLPPPPLLVEFAGATPGGARDLRFFRETVAEGRVPEADAFAPEGLLSEHDLPLAAEPCGRLLCVRAKAVEAELPAAPGVRWMAQIGLSSDRGPSERPPLNLVAVIDRSGSMEGRPIASAIAYLEAVAAQLDERDRISIVLYSRDARVHLPPTSGGRREAIRTALAAVDIEGSTDMAAGLQRGYALARQTRRTFDGITRVLLLTDERPNVGAIDAGSLAGMAELASQDGIGTTTVGVGSDFGAALAHEVSATRGSNLVYVPSPERAAEIAEDFALLTIELAYDLEIRLQPEPGVSIAGIYGVPAGRFQPIEDGGFSLSVPTVFASRSRGGLFVGLAPGAEPADLRSPEGALLQVTLSYTARDGLAEPETHHVGLTAPGPGDEGLLRGVALVDEATTLQDAASRFHGGDPAASHQLAYALGQRLQALGDVDLAPEIDLVEGLRSLFAEEAGLTVVGSAADPP